MACGRDAADMALTTAFGSVQLVSFKVHTYEVEIDQAGDKQFRPVAVIEAAHVMQARAPQLVMRPTGNIERNPSNHGSRTHYIKSDGLTLQSYAQSSCRSVFCWESVKRAKSKFF